MARSYNDASETLSGIQAPLDNSSLLDFWKWAYCDLCDDDIKGIFAEWIIVKLLKSEHPRRISWANSDLITASGVRIEVKATAYWQSYKLIDEHGNARAVDRTAIRSDSKIVFAGLKAGDATGYESNRERDFKSDLYVFAFQKETNPDVWNAMDLSQWDFFAVRREELEHSSISLAKLHSRFGPVLSAGELQQKLKAEIEVIEAEKANRGSV